MNGWLARVATGARMLVGVQDYERYRQHMHEHHPELPVLDQRAWFALMQQKRFGGAKIGKCPC